MQTVKKTNQTIHKTHLKNKGINDLLFGYLTKKPKKAISMYEAAKNAIAPKNIIAPGLDSSTIDTIYTQ